MRQTSAGLNRAWFTVLGVVLLLGGVAMVLAGTGHLAAIGQRLGFALPAPTDPVVDPASGSAFGLTWVVLIVAAAGVLVGVLGLAWLIAQIPRSNPAKPLRLHDDPHSGLTRCDSSVLAAAVEEQLRALPGVQKASAVLRGTSDAPELTLKVTAADRTDLPRLLARIRSGPAADLADALETRLHRLGVQVEVGTTTSPGHQIALQ